MGNRLLAAQPYAGAQLAFLTRVCPGLVFLGILANLAGCAEITHPQPPVAEISAVQRTVLSRYPHASVTEERAMRVFIRLLSTLPQHHGRTYPFLGFNWWITESNLPVVDNVWYPSPAQDRPGASRAMIASDPWRAAGPVTAEAGLQRGDLIMAVNGLPIPVWTRSWDRFCQALRDTFRYSFSGESLVDLVLAVRYVREEALGVYRGGPVTLLIERQGVRREITLYPIYLPASYGLLILGGRVGQEFSAYAAPGLVMITHRFASFCQNDDELALVLGHELAHHAQGHLVRREGRYALSGFLGEAVGILLRLLPRSYLWLPPRLEADLRRLVGNAAYSVYSRQDEREADAYGLWYACQAGYDPDRAINLWSRLAAVVQRDPLESTYYLDSHPAAPERLARLQQLAALFRAGRAAEVFVPEISATKTGS